MHAPPVAMLADPVSVQRHGDCLRAVLAPTSLHVAIHAPDELRLGEPAHDAAFAGLLDYAVAVGAAFVVYHGGVPADRRGSGGATASRTVCSRRSGRCGASRSRAEQVGLMIALENLAPDVSRARRC